MRKYPKYVPAHRNSYADHNDKMKCTSCTKTFTRADSISGKCPKCGESRAGKIIKMAIK